MSDDKNVNGWILNPMMRCGLYILEEIKIAALVQRSLTVLEGHHSYLKALRSNLIRRSNANFRSEFEDHIRECELLSVDAENIKKNDFNRLNQHSLVAMWGAVEAAIESTIKNILENDATAMLLAQEYGVKVRDGDDAEIISSRLERAAARMFKGKPGFAFQSLLGKFGIVFDLRPDLLKLFSEINAVRNCILHCGGVYDHRVKNVPGMEHLVGQQIYINKSDLLRYYEGMGKFVSGCLEGIASSSYLRSR